MRRLSLSLLAGAVALAAGTTAFARPEPAAQPAREMTRAVVEQRSAEAFERMDANNDGQLDQADREAFQKARFDRADSDGNGSISFAEFTAQRARQAGEAGEPRGKRFAHRAHRIGMRGPGGRHGARLADADGDGTLTRAEFQAAALERFDRLDADKDGTVTAEEGKAARESMRRQWRERRGREV